MLAVHDDPLCIQVSPRRERDVPHVPLPLGRQPRLVAHTAYGASQKLQVPPALRRRLATAALFTSGRVA